LSTASVERAGVASAARPPAAVDNPATLTGPRRQGSRYIAVYP